MKQIIKLGQLLLAGTPWLRSIRASKPRQLELPLRKK